MKFYILFFIINFLLFSCKAKINNEEKFEFFKKNMDTVYSKKVEKLINDTINKWINENLEYWAINLKIDDIIRKYKISKYIFFNSKKDKLVARVPRQVICESCVMDHIYTIIGQKIDSVWWFYDGETYAILREWVTKEIHKPIPFEKLEQIGIEETINWYYYEKKNYFWNCITHIFNSKEYNECTKTKLIINDSYYDSKNWECEHESYIDDFYDKKYDLDEKDKK